MAYHGAIKFATSIDDKGYKDGLNGLGQKAKVAFAAMAAAAVAAVGIIAKVGIAYNAEMEGYISNFTTLLGSAEAAAKRVEEIKAMAAKTPFGMAELAKSQQTLLSFGVSADKTMDVMRQLGDISLGNADRFQALTLAFAQMSSTGKLMGQDLLQMINAGFNPLQEISIMTGKSVSQLKNEMAAGSISAEMVAEAFAHATAEGSKFYNGMEAASQTLTGQWNTVVATAKALAGETFEPFNDMLKSQTLPTLTRLLREFQTELRKPGAKEAIAKLAKSFGDLIVTAGKLVSAILPVAIRLLAFAAENAAGLAVAIGAIVVATKAMTIAQVIEKAYKGFQKAQLSAALYHVAVKNITVATKAKTMADLAEAGALSIKEVLVGLLTGKITLATAAQWLWNAAMTANPIGVIIIAVAALIALLAGLSLVLGKGSKAYQEQKERVDALSESQKQLAEDQKASAEAYKENTVEINANAEASRSLLANISALLSVQNKDANQRRQLAQYVAQLNERQQGLNLLYDEENDLLSMNVKEIDAYIEAKSQIDNYNSALERQNELYEEEARIRENLALIDAELEAFYERYKNGDIGVGDFGPNGLYYELRNMREEELEHLEETAKRQQIIAGEIADADTAAAQEIIDNTEAVAEAQRKQTEAMEKALEDYTEIATDMFNRLNDETKVSVDEMTDNLLHNQQVLENWSTNIAALAERGIDAGLLQTLRDAGPESAGAVQELVNATDEQLAALSDAFANGGQAAADALARSFGFAIDSNPATEMVDGLADSISSNTSVADATEQMIIDAKLRADEVFEQQAFGSIGTNIINAIVAAVDAGRSRLITSMVNAARAMYDAAARELEINSPSRKFRIGIAKNTMDSWGMGIEENELTPVKAMERAARLIESAALSRQQKIIPTVAYGGYYSANQTTNTTQLIQNITTPKPLTPSEMSREGEAFLQRAAWQIP